MSLPRGLAFGCELIFDELAFDAWICRTQPETFVAHLWLGPLAFSFEVRYGER